MKDLRCLSDWTDMTLFHHLHKFEHWQVPSKCLHPKQIFVSAEQTWAVSKQCTHPLCLSVYMHLCISVCGGSDSDNYQELKELCGYFPPHHFLFFFVFFFKFLRCKCFGKEGSFPTSLCPRLHGPMQILLCVLLWVTLKHWFTLSFDITPVCSPLS